MRTKAILCAASLAAGALTSMAQVYSQNVVGYINGTNIQVNANAGFHYWSNPLDAAITGTSTIDPNQSATNVFPNPNPSQNPGGGPFDGSDIEIWNGASFVVFFFDSLTADTTTGFADGNGIPQPAPNLPKGKGFLFNNQSGLSTVTFVGQVRTGTNNLALPVQVQFYSIGSMTPISGTPDAIGLSNPNPTQAPNGGPLEGNNIQLLSVASNGNPLGFKTSLFWDSLTADTTTGFADGNGSPQPAPVIGLAGGFIYGAVNKPYTWTHVLIP